MKDLRVSQKIRENRTPEDDERMQKIQGKEEWWNLLFKHTQLKKLQPSQSYLTILESESLNLWRGKINLFIIIIFLNDAT